MTEKDLSSKHNSNGAYNNLEVIMKFGDDFFKKVEKKTNVDKDTIITLAQKLQNGNMKDEGTLREVIDTLSKMTGKKVTKEQSDKIISKIVDDKVPKDVDEMF